MKTTRSKIVRIAEELIRTKGYNAFSYADISKLVNVKSATIHYYFPSKSDLGVEIIKNNLSNFKGMVSAWEGLPYDKQYVSYISYYYQGRDDDWVCIMGALSPVADTLSEDMQSELKKLASTIMEWFTNLLDNGKKAGVLNYPESPKTKAYLIQSSLLASLLFNKVLKNDSIRIIQEGISL